MRMTSAVMSRFMLGRPGPHLHAQDRRTSLMNARRRSGTDNTVLSERQAQGASNPHRPNNLFLGENSAPAIFAITGRASAVEDIGAVEKKPHLVALHADATRRCATASAST